MCFREITFLIPYLTPYERAWFGKPLPQTAHKMDKSHIRLSSYS